jgi:hypothetical protein
MIHPQHIPATIREVHAKIYAAAGKKDQKEVHRLNIELVERCVKPEHYQQARRTIANLRQQMEEL